MRYMFFISLITYLIVILFHIKLINYGVLLIQTLLVLLDKLNTLFLTNKMYLRLRATRVTFML